MVITKSIPSTIKISNIQLSFRCRGQPPFCFVCQEVGHTGKDCSKSQNGLKNTRNTDLDPDDMCHKLNHVKEGDLRLKLNQSTRVSPAAPACAAATSPSNSNLTADPPHTCSKSSNSNQTHMSKPNNLNNTHNSNTIDVPNNNATDMPNGNDQPINRNHPSSSPSSSPTLSATICELKKVFKTISTLKMVFQQPSEINSTAKSVAAPNFESLACKTQSATAQSTVSISDKEASDSGF